jgi:cytochrome c-type biogenesis protein CcmH
MRYEPLRKPENVETGTLPDQYCPLIRHIRSCWLVAACVFLVPLLGTAQRNISGEYKEATDNLICQCGCNEQLSVCAMQNCSSATPMRAEIRERLQKGEGVEQIVQSFVDRYGPQVLSAPPLKGFDVTAWIMPFVMLIFGTLVVGWIVFKMIRPSAEAGAVGPTPSTLLDSRIERELKEFEEER